MKTLTAFLFVLLFTSTSFSQVVNIEARRLRTEKDGWAGEASADFFVLKEVSTVYAIEGKAQIQFKKDKSLFLFLSDLGFIKADDKDFQNSGFQHIRYNYKLTDTFLRWEVFTQAQFNKVRDIKLRLLAGTGPRFKLYDTDKMRFYIGTLYMYEYEERQSEPIIERENRISSYFSYTFNIGKLLLFGTVYYQPEVTQLDDYRLVNQTDLEFKIFDEFKFVIKYRLLYDTFPPPSVPNTSYSFSNGFKLVL
ncbi:MAG: DUF481 domain-containing protein [Ignavibacteriae bacterium]|nr:DUF481 domain-containing protein [Ignavibacteriota bacterium]